MRPGAVPISPDQGHSDSAMSFSLQLFEHVMTSPFSQSFPALRLQPLHHKKLPQIYQRRHQGCLLENWVRNPRMAFPRPQGSGATHPLSHSDFTHREVSRGKGSALKITQREWISQCGTAFITGVCVKKKKKTTLKTFHFDQSYSRIQLKLHRHKLLLKILNKTQFLIAPYISIGKVSRFELPKPPRPHFLEGFD